VRMRYGYQALFQKLISDLSNLLRIELLGRQSPALSTGRLLHSHKTVFPPPNINRIRGAIRLGDPLPWTRSTARPLTGTPEGPPATAGPCRPAARAPRHRGSPPRRRRPLPPLLVKQTAPFFFSSSFLFFLSFSLLPFSSSPGSGIVLSLVPFLAFPGHVPTTGPTLGRNSRKM
jgi:hypothetical protein